VEKYGTAGQATDGNIIWRMRCTCRMNRATEIHSAYVILIAFPRQQILCERVSVLCVLCLSCCNLTCQALAATL
jgi:hypothetical protein